MSAPKLKTTDFWKAALEKVAYYYGCLLVACFGAAIVIAIGKGLSPRESFINALIELFPAAVVLCVLVFFSFRRIHFGAFWFPGGMFVLILTLFFQWNHPLAPYAMIRVTDDGFVVSDTIVGKDSVIVTEVQNGGQRFAEEALADYWGDNIGMMIKEKLTLTGIFIAIASSCWLLVEEWRWKRGNIETVPEISLLCVGLSSNSFSWGSILLPCLLAWQFVLYSFKRILSR